jgi:hypothetical protein
MSSRTSKPSWLHVLPVVFVGLWGAMLVLAATNWLRYGLSLEGTFVVGFVLLAILLTAGGLQLARRTAGAWRRLLLTLLSGLIGGALLAFAQIEAYGSLLRFPPAHHRVRCPSQRAPWLGAEATYFVERVDPFHFGGKTYVVFENTDVTGRIELPFTTASSSYVAPSTGEDWASLERMRDPRIACLHTTARISSKTFLLFLDREQAELVASPEGKLGCMPIGPHGPQPAPTTTAPLNLDRLRLD